MILNGVDIKYLKWNAKPVGGSLRKLYIDGVLVFVSANPLAPVPKTIVVKPTSATITDTKVVAVGNVAITNTKAIVDNNNVTITNTKAIAGNTALTTYVDFDTSIINVSYPTINYGNLIYRKSLTFPNVQVLPFETDNNIKQNDISLVIADSFAGNLTEPFGSYVYDVVGGNVLTEVLVEEGISLGNIPIVAKISDVSLIDTVTVVPDGNMVYDQDGLLLVKVVDSNGVDVANVTAKVETTPIDSTDTVISTNGVPHITKTVNGIPVKAIPDLVIPSTLVANKSDPFDDYSCIFNLGFENDFISNNKVIDSENNKVGTTESAVVDYVGVGVRGNSYNTRTGDKLNFGYNLKRLFLTEEFTVSMLIKPTSYYQKTKDSSYSYLLQGVLMQQWLSSNNNASNNMFFLTTSNIHIGESSLSYGEALRLNEWNSLIMVVSRDSLGAYVKIFLNGLFVGLVYGVIGREPKTEMMIGSLWNDRYKVQAEFDNIRIFNRSLDDTEVSTLVTNLY